MKKNFRLWAAVAALLSVSILSAFSALAQPGAAVSWGVTPNTQEKTPGAPEYGAELLAGHNGIYIGDTSQRKVYFTFDLGYEAGYTAAVLDILKEHDIKAVFFLCGNYLREKDLIARMIAEGHSIGNHTDRHKNLPTLSDEGIKKDITALQENFLKEYGAPMRFFRPPEGRFCERTLRAAEAQSLRTVLWSVAIVDWGKQPIDARANADKIAGRLHPGAVILCHITNAGTPPMLKLLIPKIIEKGYTTGVPDEL